MSKIIHDQLGNALEIGDTVLEAFSWPSGRPGLRKARINSTESEYRSGVLVFAKARHYVAMSDEQPICKSAVLFKKGK